MWQVGLRISWLTQGLPTLSWPPTPEPSPPKPVSFWVLQEKQLQKIHPGTSSLLTNIFPPVSGGPWVSYSLIGKRSFLPSNLTAIAVLIEDALKLFLGGKLTIFTSHQVKQLLNGWGHLWISDQRILKYQVVLMENPSLTISLCEVLNPATLLLTPEGSFSPFTLA